MTRTRFKKPKKNKTPGRIGVYDVKSTPERTQCLMARAFTEKDLAVAFGVDITTIEYWKRNKEEFREAMEKGKDLADQNVVKSLYKAALGYSHRDTKFVATKFGVQAIPTIKQYPPDITACIFWLKNRKRAEWADVQRTEITSDVNIEINGKFDLKILTPEEQKFVRSIAIKQIKELQGVSSN